MQTSRAKLAFTLCVLLGINTMNFFDRQVLGVVAEPLRKEWRLSDEKLAGLTTAFTLLYAVVGIPLGRWADVGRRSRILAGGVALWSLLTAASAVAWNYGSLIALRLGVGVGEASCAPAANSLLGDLFPAQRRARAISLFMLGLPLGLGLSFIVSGMIAQRWGWRAALLVAGLPGLVLGLLALWIAEPQRGAAEQQAVGSAHRQGSPLRLVLSIPTMWWIIISGALHNFNMYALGQFVVPLLERYHGRSTAGAGWISGVVYGCGGLGILFGGWVCDWMVKRRISGRLEVATLAILLFVPCLFLALQRPRGDYWSFAACYLPACFLSYVYYAGVYATIQDIIEPALRGTAMALYFCAMYLLGAALGPVIMGRLSDTFAHWAATAEGSAEPGESAKAVGLHQAMYLVPIIGIALVLVLFAATRTVQRDHEKLQKWIQAGAHENEV